jgi:hypothetical protein
VGFADAWYPFAIDAMRNLRGDGAAGSDRVTMPLLNASDGIAILGQLSPALVSAITSFQYSQAKSFGANVGRSDLLDDGVLDNQPAALARMAESGALLSIADYVAGYGYAMDRPYLRFPPRGGDDRYEPFLVHSDVVSDQDGLLAFLRQTIGDWQRAVDAAAVMISSVPNVTNTAHPQDVSTFLWCVRALCRDLDVLRENPPKSSGARIKEAVNSAVHDTEEFAGKAAADIASQVGQGAGLVAKGFFSEAGVTSLIVAGIAVWLFVK